MSHFLYRPLFKVEIIEDAGGDLHPAWQTVYLLAAPSVSRSALPSVYIFRHRIKRSLLKSDCFSFTFNADKPFNYFVSAMKCVLYTTLKHFFM